MWKNDIIKITEILKKTWIKNIVAVKFYYCFKILAEQFFTWVNSLFFLIWKIKFDFEWLFF